MSYKKYEVKVYDDGERSWFNKEGQFHREDGPAIEYADGGKHWYINGQRHREDGPAVENANGTKYWFLNGLHHREDGPAIKYATGSKQWYLKGKEYTEEEYNKKMNPSLCEGKEVEIDGKIYILKEK